MTVARRKAGSGRLSLITPRTLKLMMVTLRRDPELAKVIPALSVPGPKSPSLRTTKVRTFVLGLVFAIPSLVVDAELAALTGAVVSTAAVKEVATVTQRVPT
jgi:hypothetical protein